VRLSAGLIALAKDKSMTAQRSAATSPAGVVNLTRRGQASDEIEIITETLVCLYVNGVRLATIMASPHQLDHLALGFLANEGIIDSLQDVRLLEVRPNNACVDVWLNREFVPPEPDMRTITSGCGTGITFEDLSAEHPPVTSDIHVTANQLWEAMDQLNAAAELYSRARGVHTSALSDGVRLVAVAEDIGRHNTLDKIRGIVMTKKVDASRTFLLSTGRISSEMISKARRLNISVACSRTSPTSLSVALADSWGISLVGYLRRNSMTLYTHTHRVDYKTP
jgi:FdhD protein